MIKHLGKCVVFVALQMALFLGLRAVGTWPAPPRETSVAATHTEAFLQKQLYPYWRIAPGVLDHFAELPADDPMLEAAALAFTQGPDHFLAAIKDKDRLLKEAPGPRLICIGGSGLAFGWDSELLGERYGYHPINLGLHIRLGPDFMLKHAMRHVREGDVVVVSIEYDGMLANFETTPERRDDLLRIAPELADYFEEESAPRVSNWSDRVSEWQEFADEHALAEVAREARAIVGTAADTTFDPANESWKRFLADFTEHREEILAAFGRCPWISLQLYRRSGFNEYGDLITHRRHSRPTTVSMEQFAPKISTGLSDSQIALLMQNIERLNHFAGECARRGASVYFAYPPLFNTPDTEEFADAFAAITESHLRMPILNSIDAAILDESLFFDSDNHLNWEGTCRRMANVVEGLDQHLVPKTILRPHEHIARRRGTLRKTTQTALAGEETPIR